jgi:hypothetical protein
VKSFPIEANRSFVAAGDDRKEEEEEKGAARDGYRTQIVVVVSGESFQFKTDKSKEEKENPGQRVKTRD